MTTTTNNEQLLLYIDNTKRRSFSSCPRKFYYEHILNLRPLHSSTALRFGLTWHSILEEYYSIIKASGWNSSSQALTAGVIAGKKSWDQESDGKTFYPDYRTLENCLSAFMSYVDYYKEDAEFIQITEVEKKFSIQLEEDIFFTGRIDAKVKLNGSSWLLEHKTTGMPIDNQLKTLTRDPQIIGYNVAGLYEDSEIEGVLVSMTHVSSTKSKVTGLYGKTRVEHRRSPQIFTRGDRETWLNSFLWTARQIKHSLDTNYWPCQLDSCYRFGVCAYTQLCEQNCADLSELNTQNFNTVKQWNVLE